MISNDLVQAAIVAKLKAATDLVVWLTARSAENEIREAQWQGTVFVFPAVRVDLGTQEPTGNGPCYLFHSEMPFSILSYGEKDSSQEADQLAGLVDGALLGAQFDGTGFTTGLVKSDGLVSAVRIAERLWRATGLYRVYLYGSR